MSVKILVNTSRQKPTETASKTVVTKPEVTPKKSKVSTKSQDIQEVLPPTPPQQPEIEEEE